MSNRVLLKELIASDLVETAITSFNVFLATIQNFANRLWGQHIDGHAHQSQSHDGCATHGIHIADGVGGGDAAKVKRVIHDGHEEVGGGNQRLLIVELVHRCVVGCFNAHQQLGWDGHGAGAFENLAQHAWGNLAAATTTVREAGEARDGVGV